MTRKSIALLACMAVIAGQASGQGGLSGGDGKILPVPQDVHQLAREARNSPVTGLGFDGHALLDDGTVNWTLVDFLGAEAIHGKLDDNWAQKHLEKHRPIALAEKEVVNQLLELLEQKVLDESAFRWLLQQANSSRNVQVRTVMEQSYGPEQLERASQFALDAATREVGFQGIIDAALRRTGKSRRLTDVEKEKIKTLVAEARKELEPKVRELREEQFSALMEKTEEKVRAELTRVELEEDLVTLSLVQEVRLRIAAMPTKLPVQEARAVVENAKAQDRELMNKAMALRNEAWKKLLPQIGAVIGFDLPNIFSLKHRAQ